MLWLLTRTDDWDYDEVLSMVVRASTEEEARATAAAYFTDGPYPEHRKNEIAAFTDPGHSTCEPIDTTGEPAIVHVHMHHG